MVLVLICEVFRFPDIYPLTRDSPVKSLYLSGFFSPIQKSVKTPKTQSEAVIRRWTTHTMVKRKRKRKAVTDKKKYRKFKIKQHESNWKLGCELSCSGRVISTCFTSCTRRVILVKLRLYVLKEKKTGWNCDYDKRNIPVVICDKYSVTFNQRMRVTVKSDDFSLTTRECHS